ncbi:DNA polymerase III subunit chi [Halochromatium salexigens]|uniref:DNA polymerase III subunit chi n=1 Tax=Halochromatium salexigens TaxID=49447 RepID=A0AAJ0XGM8_HALSE|nr:DNA polymerase III subunit chi [Halochromatium salexigens]MBK5931708.1 DNA polymerase III subunit chi [Halochromatium salexigens]
MTRVDFYILRDDSRSDRFGLTCRLVERIRKPAPEGAQPPRVLIYCPDARQARHLDRLLWSFREDSFLPHGLVGETDTALTPILISSDARPEDEHQVLINLSPSAEAPAFHGRFERLCEPLDHDPEIRQAGRKRYRYYRDNGHPLAHHEVG